MASKYNTEVSGGLRQAGNKVALSRALVPIGTLQQGAPLIQELGPVVPCHAWCHVLCRAGPCNAMILEGADHLITVWNERQAKRMPMLFSPTIGAAITAGFWFLRARCPACRTTGDVDLRTLDWHHGAAVTALTPALSCRSCRPNAPFAELVCLSKSSVAEEYYAERSGNRWVIE